MRVLSHGIPFFCNETPLRLYDGPHELRYVGNWTGADFRYDPLAEDAPAVIDRIAEDWQPDLLLCWMPEVHPPPVGIEACPIPTVALVSDWNVFYPVLHQNLARYDVVLCDTPGVQALKNDLVTPHHLEPLYSHISTVHKDYGTERDIDVLFVGNLNHAAHAVRARYLARIAQLSDRYNVVITSGVFDDDYGRLMSRAKIVFNHSIRGELNLRVFETIACGALPFLERDNLEVRKWFRPGDDIVLYGEDNLEELICAHLDQWETLGAPIAARAHERAPALAGEHRFTDVIDGAARLPQSGRPFRNLPPGEQAYQTLMMYGFSRWPVYNTLEAALVNNALELLPDDPRVWTAAGQHLANAYSKAGTDRQRQERFLKAFLRAAQLAPDSAVCALNVATAFRACGDTANEMQWLVRAGVNEGIGGWELLVGAASDPLLTRWNRACAEKTADSKIVNAEAKARLGRHLADPNTADVAIAVLTEAGTMDPENLTYRPALAEVQWLMGKRQEAVTLMRDQAADFPLDMALRERLIAMYTELGRIGEAQALAEQSVRIARACRDVLTL